MKQPIRDYHPPDDLVEFYRQALERSRNKQATDDRKTLDGTGGSIPKETLF